MISSADREFMKKWEVTLQKGRLRHHLKFGSFYGIFMFVFVTLFDLAEKSFVDAYFSLTSLLKLGSWLAGALLLYAPIIWWDSNRRYKKMKEKYDNK